MLLRCWLTCMYIIKIKYKSNNFDYYKTQMVMKQKFYSGKRSVIQPRLSHPDVFTQTKPSTGLYVISG